MAGSEGEAHGSSPAWRWVAGASDSAAAVTAPRGRRSPSRTWPPIGGVSRLLLFSARSRMCNVLELLRHRRPPRAAAVPAPSGAVPLPPPHWAPHHWARQTGPYEAKAKSPINKEPATCCSQLARPKTSSQGQEEGRERV